MSPRAAALTLAIAVPAIAVPSFALGGIVGARIYPAPTTPLSLDGLAIGRVSDASLIEVTTLDGLVLKGIARPPEPGMPVVLVFHGNGSSASGTAAWLAPALPAGFGIVAAEYRGYSGNPGKPDEAGLSADADAFADRATLLANGAPVWVVGHSLGGGVALGLAARRSVAAPIAVVVTICTFTRLRDMAPKFARAFVPDAYRNTDAVARVAAPYFLVHGTHDAVIPVAHGEALHGAAGKAKRVGASFVIAGEDHQPSASSLAAVFRVVARALPAGGVSAEGLPAGITLVPFARPAAADAGKR